VKISENLERGKMRKGDCISAVIRSNRLHNEDILIYNGEEFIHPDHDWVDEYEPILPSSIQINDYPTTGYFSKSFPIDIVWFNTEGTGLKLLNQYKNSDKHPVYQYITTGKSGGYEIWMYEPLTEKNWKGILPFEGASSSNQERGTDFLNVLSNISEDEEITNIIYNKIITNQNLRVLYQNETYNYPDAAQHPKVYFR
jgi:hypothetical protein